MPSRDRLSRAPRILVASNQDHGLRDFESFLRGHGYLVLRVYAGAPVLEEARAMRPEVILLDVKLPDRQSLDLGRSLRDDPLVGPSTPVLVLMTGQPTPQDHLAALRAGIWELLPQPLDSNEMLLKLNAYVLAKVEGDRALKTSVDDLTGLYTAHGLARRTRELLFQASQHNTSAACVVFAPELEGAAQPASTGSRSLRQLVPRVAQVLKAIGRRSDAIGRVGATGFAVVAPGTDASGAVKLAERFRQSVRTRGTGKTGETDATPGFELRAGYDAVANVRYTPVEPTDLLARAARALQMAKDERKWVRESSGR